MAFPKARVLLAPPTDTGAGGLVAVDSDDLVIGATRSARLALGITEECLKKPLPVADIFAGSAKEGEKLGEAERGMLQRALARVDGNVSAPAQALGISRSTLHRKLRRLGLGKSHCVFARLTVANLRHLRL